MMLGLFIAITFLQGIRSDPNNNLVEGWLFKEDKTVLPQNGAAGVKIDLWISEVSTIHEKEMDFSIAGKLNLWRKDHRLKSNGTNKGFMAVPKKYWDKVCTPSLYFSNQKDVKSHSVPVKTEVCMINGDGDLYYAVMFTGKYTAQMDFHHYPFDVQILPIEITLLPQDEGKEKKLSWQSNDTDYLRDKCRMVAAYGLVDLRQKNCRDPGCLRMELIVKRDLGFYLIQFFIPSILIVALSWAPFWIDIDITGNRITVLLATIFTMAAMIGRSQANMPMAGYMKALDIWLFTCLSFIILSLVQTIFVKAYAKYAISKLKNAAEDQKEKKMEDQEGLGLLDNSHSHDDEEDIKKLLGPLNQMVKILTNIEKLQLKNTITNKDAQSHAQGLANIGKRKAKRVNNICKVVFPSLFLLFNIVYWCEYMTLNQNTE